MKIIALLPFKNEEYLLPIYLKNVLPIVDEIIAIDDNSTDCGRQILENSSSKVKVYSNTEVIKSGWSEFNIRQRLLELGRESDGTHFVCLDADETFTSNFVPVAKNIINKLQPGQKIALQWLALWKSVDHYRNDSSVWSNNYKDFIVYDDPKNLKHDYVFLGVGRTPGINNDETWLKLNTKYGAVLHYQFSHWNNFQLKQAWYRMSELIKMGPGNEGSINQKYSITLEQKSFVSKCPDEWLKDIPKYDIDNIPSSWHIIKIQEWLKEYGKEYFKNLDIWHIPQLKENT